MNRFDKSRVVAGIIALVCFAIAYVILSVLIIEASKAEPVAEPQVWTGPPIPKCDKELWLRITEGCK